MLIMNSLLAAILVLFASLPVSVASSTCSYVTCVSYDPDENVCYASSQDASSHTRYRFSTCPSDTYCDYSLIGTSTDKLSCMPVKEAGESCTYYIQCRSKYCINGKCSTRRAKQGELVLGDTECGKGLFMETATKKCTRQSAAGYTCDIGSLYYACRARLVCNDDYCWQPMSLAIGTAATNKEVCKTLYINSTTGLCGTAPKLQSIGSNGLKNCATATADTDCKYAIGDTIFSASKLNKSCVCTQYAGEIKQYCELGEGDDLFIANYKTYLKSIENDERNMDKIMQVEMYRDTSLYVQRFGAASCTPYFVQSRAEWDLGVATAISIVIVLVFLL